MGWPTAQTVATQAALELGLIQSVDAWGDDVYQSADSTVSQFLAFLKKAGRDLVDEADWTQLRAEHSILTESIAVAAAIGAVHQRWGAYVLPPDWRAMVNQSGWNRTTRFPLGGPLSEQEWQYLSAQLVGVVFNVLIKPMQGLMYLYPSAAIPNAQAITMAYKSSRWVQAAAVFVPAICSAWEPDSDYVTGEVVFDTAGAGGVFYRNIYRCVQNGHSDFANGPDPANTPGTGTPTTSGVIIDGTVHWNWIGCVTQTTSPDGQTNIQTASFGMKDVPTGGADLVMFDEALIVAKLKYLWLKEKGFGDDPAEYQRLLGTITSNDQPGRILSLNRGGMTRDRLLDGSNIPITGFGS